MYDLTDAAKNAIAAEQPYTAKATIYLADLTEIELTEADLVNTGFAYSAQVLSGEKFVPGSVCASSVTLTLNNIEGKFTEYNFYGAEFVPYIACRPLNGDAIDWLQLTRYTIIDPVISNSEIIELLGYDNIYKLSAEYDEGLSFPATLKEIVQYCCSKCNLILNTSNFPLDSFEVQREVDLTDATYQQIMSYVAAIAGCWVSINRQGQVVLDWFADTPMHTIGKDRMLSISAQSDDVEITGVRVKAMGTEQDYGETFMVGTEGYVLEFSDNPFIQENTAQTVAQSLASKLNGMTLRPMTVEIIPDISVEIGDCFSADGVKGYLTNFSYTINDRMKLQCKAESAPASKLKTFSNNVITQIKQNAIVHEQLGAYDLNVQEMNKLAANTMGFYYTQEEQDDGSIIAYWHDKPNLTESTIIYKQGIDGFFLSQDGGKTYTTGRDSQGNAVVNILSAIGIQASWLNIDDVITRINEDGTETIDAGHVSINGHGISSYFASQETVSEISDAVEDLEETVTTKFSEIDQTTDSISATVGAISQTTDAQSEAIAQLQITANGITQTVQEAIEASGIDELSSRVSSVEQTANGIEIKISEMEQYGDTVEQINRFFDFLQAGLKTGLDGSPFYTLLNETELGFYENGNRVAYISNNSLYISSARIQNDLILENPASGDLVRWYVDSAGYVCLQSTSA